MMNGGCVISRWPGSRASRRSWSSSMYRTTWPASAIGSGLAPSRHRFSPLRCDGSDRSVIVWPTRVGSSARPIRIGLPIKPDFRTTRGSATAAIATNSCRRAESGQACEWFLHLARFNGAGRSQDHLLSMTEAAEDAGFCGISLMDHLTQIPQVGQGVGGLSGGLQLSRLSWPAAPPRFASGLLVTNVGLRNPALLAKMLATIDVLSKVAPSAGWGRVGSRPS